jgi:alkanesulfonate monooxygenase SsuD/methylene tetrahydromethanopterin reductase-like flavin-dependent oxidoreductase (luciferase family)
MQPEFGLAIDFARPADPGADCAGQIRTLIQLAEMSGFQSVWAGEQYAADAARIHLPAPFILLASLIPQTTLKLGTGVIVLPAYHPLRLAYETALLDILSDGRLIVGAGVGNPVLARRFGVDPARIADVSDDALGAMRALWAGESSFQGKTVTIDDGIQPLPVQAGGPPLWVGGRIKRAARRAARYGTGWFAGMHFTHENIVQQVAAYREELAAIGKDTIRPTVAVNRLLVLADSEAEARAAGGPAVDPPDPTATVPLQLVGTPDAVAATIRTYVEAGVTNMQVRVFPPGVSFEHAVRTMTLFRTAVLPQLG